MQVTEYTAELSELHSLLETDEKTLEGLMNMISNNPSQQDLLQLSIVSLEKRKAEHESRIAEIVAAEAAAEAEAAAAAEAEAEAAEAAAEAAEVVTTLAAQSGKVKGKGKAKEAAASTSAVSVNRRELNDVKAVLKNLASTVLRIDKCVTGAYIR